MQTLHTVRVRDDFIRAQLEKAGGVTALAQKLDVDASTVSRQINQRAEASPRFIGAILSHIPVSFSDAFDVVEEPVRARLARTVRRPAA